MKSWILVLGIFPSVLLPLSLWAADQSSPDPSVMMDDAAKQEQDFSPLLCDEAFADSSYHFFRRLSRDIEWWSNRVARRAARYPDAPVCQYWAKRATDNQIFLEKREENIRVTAFVTVGIYPEKDFLDQQNSSQFKKLQDRLFKSYTEYLMDPDGADVQKMEEDLMVDLKDFCTQSKDPFFSETVFGFLGSASTRMEALLNALPSFNEEEWLSEKQTFLDDSDQMFRRLASQFDSLQSWFAQRLQNMIKETFSYSRMMELLEDVLSGEQLDSV